jgi:transposase
MTTSMQTKLRRKQGRKSKGPSFVQLFKYMLDSPAWLALSAVAKAAYVQLARRYDGVNNGLLGLSARTLAEELGVSKGTAARALIQLEDAGFIETVTLGRFARRNHQASEYRLTTFRCDKTGELPTKKFMRSQPIPETIGEVPTLKPWAAQGISERTWYRRRLAGQMAVPRSHQETVTVSPEGQNCQMAVSRYHHEYRQAGFGTSHGLTTGTHIESLPEGLAPMIPDAAPASLASLPSFIGSKSVKSAKSAKSARAEITDPAAIEAIQRDAARALADPKCACCQPAPFLIHRGGYLVSTRQLVG